MAEGERVSKEDSSGGFLNTPSERADCAAHFLLAAFLDHIDYVVRKVGVEHVAIGTDVAYRSRNDER